MLRNVLAGFLLSISAVVFAWMSMGGSLLLWLVGGWLLAAPVTLALAWGSTVLGLSPTPRSAEEAQATSRRR